MYDPGIKGVAAEGSGARSGGPWVALLSLTLEQGSSDRVVVMIAVRLGEIPFRVN